MAIDLQKVAIYHITHVSNLPGILAEGGLHSDKVMAKRDPTLIGHNHIKLRRLNELPVQCCGWRYVGAFVPFYFCPRSPMLFTINKGNTGHPPGCQTQIVHLVSTAAFGIATGREWAVSDGNAGAYHTMFYNEAGAIEALDWKAIRATSWQGMTHQKSAEFLVADFFPWAGIEGLGCYGSAIAETVKTMLKNAGHVPAVQVHREWYY